MSGDAVSARERARLRDVARQYEAMGYQVVSHPQPDELPAELRPFQPDMIARGPDETVIVEIKTRSNLRGDEKLADLAESIARVPGWRLEFVMTNPRHRDAVAGLDRPVQVATLASRLSEAKKLIELGYFGPAILVTWGVVEGSLAYFDEDRTDKARATSIGFRLKSLYSRGSLEKQTYTVLADSYSLRAALAHGRETKQDLETDARSLVREAKRLVREASYISRSAAPEFAEGEQRRLLETTTPASDPWMLRSWVNRSSRSHQATDCGESADHEGEKSAQPRRDEMFSELPVRVAPYITMDWLNQPLDLLKPSLSLGGPEPTEAFEGNMFLRWIPSAAIEVDGVHPGPLSPGSEAADRLLILETGDAAQELSIHVTTVTHGPDSSHVAGLLSAPVAIGQREFEVLRFNLANFPSYLGAWTRDSAHAYSARAGRLELVTREAVCCVDVIPEVETLRRAAAGDAGFVISHVGEWRPLKGRLTQQEAEDALALMHFWFGFLRGAWTGPLLAQGLNEGKVVWRHFANPKISESQQVATWLPERRPLDVSEAFCGFVRRWHDPRWQDPLKFAISWLVQANAARTSLDSRIVLAQIALELLSWTHVVDDRKLQRRKVFKKLSSADQIRELLRDLEIPLEIPQYMPDLAKIRSDESPDGPGVVTRVRNALVHGTEPKRALVQSLSGRVRLECAQLALQYVDLVLLRLCDHNGHYAARGWKGWKGDDEIPVPWV